MSIYFNVGILKRIHKDTLNVYLYIMHVKTYIYNISNVSRSNIQVNEKDWYTQNNL